MKEKQADRRHQICQWVSAEDYAELVEKMNDLFAIYRTYECLNVQYFGMDPDSVSSVHAFVILRERD